MKTNLEPKWGINTVRVGGITLHTAKLRFNSTYVDKSLLHTLVTFHNVRSTDDGAYTVVRFEGVESIDTFDIMAMIHELCYNTALNRVHGKYAHIAPPKRYVYDVNEAEL